MKPAAAATFVLILFTALSAASERPDSDRPLQDIRYLAAVTRANEGFDVFWLRRNELVVPVHDQLFRNRFAPDGRQLGPAVLVNDFGPNAWFSGVDAADTQPAVVIWNDTSSNRVLTSPISDDRLKYPAGNEFVRDADVKGIACGRSTCLLMTQPMGLSTIATPLNVEGTAAGQAFNLPFFWYAAPNQTVVGNSTIFSTYKTASGDVHATLTDFTGRLIFDELVITASPHGSVAVDFDGERFVLAWVKEAFAGWGSEGSTTIEAATIALDGTMTSRTPLDITHTGLGGFDQVALAWNGSNHLLACVEAFITGNQLRLVRLDRDLKPLDTTAVASIANIPFGMVPLLKSYNETYAIAWTASSGYPYAAFLTGDGHLVGPFAALDSAPRRRAVR